MKIVKIILGLIVVLAVAIGILSFIIPKEMTIEKSIIVDVPKERAYDYLRFFEHQEQWGPWYKQDPDMKITTTGTDGEVGYIVAWEGNSKVGVGEQEIKALTQDERIDTELRFKKPMEGVSQGWFITEAAGINQTKITWGMHSVSERPLNALCFIMNAVTGMLDDMFEQGLNDLKSVLENGEAS